MCILSLREKFEKERRKGKKNGNKFTEILRSENTTTINEIIHQRFERQFDVIYPGTTSLIIYLFWLISFKNDTKLKLGEELYSS